MRRVNSLPVPGSQSYTQLLVPWIMYQQSPWTAIKSGWLIHHTRITKKHSFACFFVFCITCIIRHHFRGFILNFTIILGQDSNKQSIKMFGVKLMFFLEEVCYLCYSYMYNRTILISCSAFIQCTYFKQHHDSLLIIHEFLLIILACLCTFMCSLQQLTVLLGLSSVNIFNCAYIKLIKVLLLKNNQPYSMRFYFLFTNILFLGSCFCFFFIRFINNVGH